MAKTATSATAATSTRYVTIVAASAALGGFLFGFDTSTMNSAIDGITETLDLSTGAVGFVVAIVLLGCAAGAWFAGGISARFGRTRVMLIAGALITIGSVAAALVGNVWLMGAFRFATGLGIGAASAVVPAYISEIAPTRIRGRLGTFWQFAIVIGQLLGLLAGYGVTQWAGDEADPLPWGGAAWRWMFVVVAILALAYMIIAWRLPPSPPDLVRHGHDDQAKALLVRIDAPAADERITAIHETLAEQGEAASLSDLRGSTFGLRSIVWIGIALAAFQQLVGINIVKTYSNTLWQSVGFSTSASFSISIVTVLISVASTVVAISIMDRVGRRTLLLAGAAVLVIALGTLAICFSMATGSGDDVSLDGAPATLALIAINVFAVGFGVTWGPVMWIVLSELFDSDLRTTAVAVCTAVNWLTNWVVTRSFPTLADISLSFAYSLYTVFAILAFIFVLKALPETKDRALS
jgi:SP family sugar:H+ symporter-like MFS transporter